MGSEDFLCALLIPLCIESRQHFLMAAVWWPWKSSRVTPTREHSNPSSINTSLNTVINHAATEHQTAETGGSDITDPSLACRLVVVAPAADSAVDSRAEAAATGIVVRLVPDLLHPRARCKSVDRHDRVAVLGQDLPYVQYTLLPVLSRTISVVPSCSRWQNRAV